MKAYHRQIEEEDGSLEKKILVYRQMGKFDNSCLMVIPLFFLSFFKILKKVIPIITSLQRNSL